MKNIIGNEPAKMEIREYMETEADQPLFFYGPKGIGKRTLAEQVAANRLHCEVGKLYRHPDYFYYADKLKAEDIQLLLQSSRRKSVVGKKVFLLDHVARSEQMNKLLKLLEDRAGTNLVMFLSDEALLPTIESRCRRISFAPLSGAQMEEYLTSCGLGASWPWYAFLSKNCPGRLEEKKELFAELHEVYQKLLSMQKSELFRFLHLVEEKDKENYYDRFKNNLTDFLSLFQFLFLQILERKLGILKEDDKRLEAWTQSYTLRQTHVIMERLVACQSDELFDRNQFFTLIRKMVE